MLPLSLSVVMQHIDVKINICWPVVAMSTFVMCV